MMKSDRHAAILEIVDSHNVQTQEELARMLGEAGIEVTQATVSRDIKELRLVKVLASNGGYKYATIDKAEAGMKERLARIFSDTVLAITASGNLVIIKTLSGSANAAGEAIDSMHFPEIAGSLAGDNTIFVAVKEQKNTQELVRQLNLMLKNK